MGWRVERCLKVLGHDDPERFKRLDVRFTSPVYPGEPLRSDIWKIAPGDAAFRVVATDRKVVVEDFGRFEYVELRDQRSTRNDRVLRN